MEVEHTRETREGVTRDSKHRSFFVVCSSGLPQPAALPEIPQCRSHSGAPSDRFVRSVRASGWFVRVIERVVVC